VGEAREELLPIGPGLELLEHGAMMGDEQVRVEGLEDCLAGELVAEREPGRGGDEHAALDARVRAR
jgi:hypothetical protein